MYFRVDSRKTCLEIVLHNVSVCVPTDVCCLQSILKVGGLPLVQLSLHVVTDQAIKVTADASAL